MTEAEFKRKTKGLAVECMRIAEGLPKGRSAEIIAKQLIRCASSVGANYRAVCRAKSANDMAFKLNIVLEEADETMYWLELAVAGGLLEKPQAEGPHRQAEEITAMCVASIQTLRKRDSKRAQTVRECNQSYGDPLAGSAQFLIENDLQGFSRIEELRNRGIEEN